MRARRCAFVAALALELALATACEPAHKTGKPAPRSGAERTMVVINRRSALSDSVGRYYIAQRGIPSGNVVMIDVPVGDEVNDLEFRSAIVTPVRNAIEAAPYRVDFIVLTKDVPIRVARKNGYSVDALLSGMNLPVPPMVGLDTAWLRRYRNPYFDSRAPFNSDAYGMFLVTRLDCDVIANCIALVDRATAARSVGGPFFFDAMPLRKGRDGYAEMNQRLYSAAFQVRLLGYVSQLDSAEKFVAPSEPVMGYVSWGSNDGHFDSTAYHAVRFLPGALAETFVSTSARTFGPVKEGQSRIVDLIAQGVTGVKGYVSEPYTYALAKPEILFDRYLRGATLAEAFYAASPMILWKDLIIGDPLCAPYAIGMAGFTP